MNDYLPKIVFRNLLRHRARTLSGLLAIVFGVIALLIASGFIDWIYWAMRESTIESRLGHIQVVKPGYLDHGSADPFAYLLPERSPILDSIKTMPSVEVVTPRLSFSGLVSHGEATLSFLGEGVKPDSEARVSLQLRIVAGEGLSAADAREVLLGKGLARGLGVEPGDSVVLLATTSSGGINAVELRVQGIFQTYTKTYDDVALRLPIDVARSLVRVAGSHVWVVLLDETDKTPAVLEKLHTRFPQVKSGLQFIPWYEQADFYKKTVRLFSRQVRVVWILIAVVVVLSISNTMIMSVMERTREIGTLLALGFRRGKILRQFIAEGLALGMVGGGVGLVAGTLLARLISYIGIPMPPPPGMGVGFTGKVAISWMLAGEALLFALVISVLASVYPAWKASRLQIVDALRRSG